MASYLSLGNYSGTLRIPEFKGLNQYGDGIGLDPRYAMEASNVLTTEGVLRPMSEHTQLSATLPTPIETLARLYRRWHANKDEKEVLIAASEGQLYWMLPGGSEWTQIGLPDGWIGSRYQLNTWSYVTYEINPEGSTAPIDVILLSNAKDGMIMVRGDNLTASIVPTPKKFGVITRYAERIWGGAIENDPDMLVYSAPYDPFDWAQNNEYPEDGAGDIQQPSWDGDSFMALVPFGSQLIALKRNRVWRVLGTNPGEYMFKEQYGGGTAYANSVVVDGSRILMLGNDGLLQYNGESVAPYYQEYASNIWARMNLAEMDKSFACKYKDNYYCAIPLDESQENNAVVIYNTVERTWMLRDGIRVEAFLPTEEALYYTSTTTPGMLWRWEEDGERACAIHWATGWQDFGHKNMVKGGWTVYLTVECEAEVALNISIQTEKKLKTKTVVFDATADGKLAKQKRMAFGGSGRRFRLMIDSDGSVPWKLIGGMQIEAETDVD